MTKESQQNDDRAVNLSILSDPKNLAVVRSAAEKIARQQGFAAGDVDGIVLAVDEALANIMRHGYEGCKDRQIRVCLEALTDAAKGDALRITVKDRGKQVDPGTIEGRDLEDVRPGGLGVHIIRAVMDHVEYHRRKRGGMQLQMVKYVKGKDTLVP
jgi:anti-sigma regulatory factor (Ser/Thr protein kinase)